MSPALLLALVVLVLALVGCSGKARDYADLPACKIMQQSSGVAEVLPSGEVIARTTARGRIVVIGDIHGTQKGLHDILVASNLVEIDDVDCTWSSREANRDTTLVQMGDLVDRGDEALEAMQCLEHLYSTMLTQRGEGSSSAMIRIIGNHEVWWLEGRFHMRNKRSDTEDKVLQMVRMMKDQVQRREMVGAHTIRINGVDLLFVHAGYRAAYLTHLVDTGLPNARSAAEEVVRHFNAELPRVIARCHDNTRLPCDFGDDDELFQAGPERGGSHLGGPIWTDFRVLVDDDRSNGAASHSTDWIQIVGHSAADSCDDGDDSNGYPDLAHCKELIRTTGDMEAVCVDGGMVYGTRSFLEVNCTTGVFVAHEGKHTEHAMGELTMEWSRRELNPQLCAGMSSS